MEAFMRDVRNAVRFWGSTPGFTTIVVMTLASGIGANTAVFSVINTLFLNPLLVSRPGELVTIRTVDAGVQSADALPISHLNLEDIRERNQVFQELAGHSSPTVLTQLVGEAPRRLFAEVVTGNYFDVLGIRPVRGRFFLPEEDKTPGASPVLVLAHAAWQTRFGGAEDIVGQTVRIGSVTFTVIGVAPEGFKGVNAVFGPDVWIPAMMVESALPSQMQDWLRNRSALGFRGVGRLKPAVSPAQAGADLSAIAATLERDYPDANRGRGLAVEPLTRASLIAPEGMSAATISVMLLAIPGLMLLIACSNVANLLSARAASRRQEIAVRLAVGADRLRLVRQLLTESMALACVSGIVGFGLAYAGVQLLWSFRPSEVAANLIDLDIDVNVFLFALGVSLLTGVLFGLVPAWQSARTDVVRGLSDDGRTAGPGRRTLTVGRMLMIGQVALSLVALVTAGLVVRSLQQAYRVDPGFESRRLGIAMMSPGQAGYTRVRSEHFYEDVRARVSALPGVISASWATQLPLFARPSRSVVIEGRDAGDQRADIVTIVNAVDVGYFATVGMTLTRGRDLTAGDREGSLPVALVNEALAARAWPGLEPLGKRLRLAGEDVTREVVGVIKTANYSALGEAPQPCLYLPLRQQFVDAAVLYVRTDTDPTAILGTVQRTVRAIDGQIDVSDVRTIETVISQSLFGATAGVGLLTVFGLLSLALASLGLYGATAHAVKQRRREIGTRMALGAPRLAISNLVLRQGLTPVAIGIVLGGAMSVVVGRLMSGVLFGVTAADPVSLAGASTILTVVAAVANYLPARQASRIDPILALREQ